MGCVRSTGSNTCLLYHPSQPATLPFVMVDLLTLSDENLLSRAQAGEVAAFGLLVDRHQTLVRGWLRIRLADWAAADDVAQEVFVTAFRRLATFTGEGPFPGWLIGIARNHLRNHLRKHHEEAVGGSEELARLVDQGMAEAFPERDAAQLVTALRTCLEPLGSHARELLEQRYVAGQTVRELAARTGRGYSALTMQLHRLRETLADCITTRLAQDGGA